MAFSKLAAMGKRVVLPDHPSNAYFKANFAERSHFFELQAKKRKEIIF